MWIIVGLGNPGIRYTETRHNIGFRVIKHLSEHLNIKLKKDMLYAIGQGAIEGIDILLLKPLTFMNRSGHAVKELLKSINENNKGLIVIQDDIDIETGIVKIRRKGSSGGHRGIQSIIEQLSTEDFIRVKVGIGRDKGIAVEDYVLEKFSIDEEKIIKESINQASMAVIKIITHGVEMAMNEFNRPKEKIC